MLRIILLMSFSLILVSTNIFSQSVHQTFKDTRVINSQSVETLKKGILDFRIGHRFGDVNGGWATMWGLENAADVIFEFDYGLTDNWMVGLMRAKGNGPLKQNVSGLMKFKVIKQGRSPFSATVSSLMSVSTMRRNPDNPGVINFFEKSAHRISYNLQVIFASKLSERMAIQLAPQWTYRNIVPADDTQELQDKNDLPSLSGAFKFQFNKTFALIFDMTIPFSEYRNDVDDNGDRNFYYPLGVGFEWETGGGHVFQINLTNASGIVETDYIPYTTNNWADGEYRLGFTISRHFKL